MALQDHHIASYKKPNAERVHNCFCLPEIDILLFAFSINIKQCAVTFTHTILGNPALWCILRSMFGWHYTFAIDLGTRVITEVVYN